MQKIIVPISKCIPGMITASPIIDLTSGTTILSANHELTPDTLENMRHFIHTDIWVYLDSFNKVWQLSPEAVENYKKYTNTLMSLISDLSTNELKDISDFETFCEHLPLEFTSNHTLLGCTHLMETLDYTTFNHSLNVAFIAMLICKWAGLDENFTITSMKAALLHDMGSLNLSFNPFELKKPWSKEQVLEYEKHPIYSFNLVNKLPGIEPAIPKAILAHHEHCDGTGFPIKISSPYINLLGKVLCLADTYEILKQEMHIFQVLKTLLVDRMTEFDPKLLLTFCTSIATYYVGTFVILNDGQMGEVVFINPSCLYRPIIKINNTFLNLYNHSALEIISVR